MLVVDDAVVMRKLITETLATDPEIEVVGTAPNGKIALQKIPQVNPEVVTLDIEMPEMDGLATLRQIRKLYPNIAVIMFSTLTRKGAEATLDALTLGAKDYVTKPANVGSVTEGMARMQEELIPKIKSQAQKQAVASARSFPIRPPAPISARVRRPVELVCIGTSTGGPNALAELFANLPKDFPTPIVIVQHMPPLFTAMLAERLSAHSSVPCQEGTDGQTVEQGRAYLAPGGHHMEVKQKNNTLVLRLHDGVPENSCRPAVDVLFRSAAAVCGGATLGVVMTGMGQDGMRGCEVIREQGGRVIVQDEASSVVWGMPGAVVGAGLAETVFPLPQIAPAIRRIVEESRRK